MTSFLFKFWSLESDETDSIINPEIVNTEIENGETVIISDISDNKNEKKEQNKPNLINELKKFHIEGRLKKVSLNETKAFKENINSKVSMSPVWREILEKRKRILKLDTVNECPIEERVRNLENSLAYCLNLIQDQEKRISQLERNNHI